MALPKDLSFLANLPGQLVQNPNASGNNGQLSAGNNYASASDPDLLNELTKIRQYDQGASLAFDPNGLQGKGTYSVSFDQGKMPAVPKSTDGQLWARSPQNFADDFQQQMKTGGGSDAIYHSVIDPSKNITGDYGTLTPGSNVTTKHVPTKPGMLDTLGPLAVGLAAGGLPSLFSGLPGAGAGIGGELAASAAGSVGPPSAFGTALTKGAMTIPQTLGNNNSAGQMLQGLAGKLPGWLFQILKGS